MAGVLAYVNHGRWVADCPECAGGILASPDADPLSPVLCRDCGAEVEIEYPDARAIAEAEHVLAQRRPENRNWLPDRESVDDLKAENALRGVAFAGR